MEHTAYFIKLCAIYTAALRHWGVFGLFFFLVFRGEGDSLRSHAREQ